MKRAKIYLKILKIIHSRFLKLGLNDEVAKEAGRRITEIEEKLKKVEE